MISRALPSLSKTAVFALALIMLAMSFPVSAADTTKNVLSLSQEEVMKLTNEELLALPLEDLMALAEKFGVSVDDLLNMKVSVSSKKALSTRESPGILSIVTAEEIQNSGARDLIDVLNLVPGFNFGYDVEGAVGVGMRGIWGHEGKVLLLIDGQEMNELMYSTLQFGSHYDVSQIKRIEIMRGPGSCVYGGFAELGVINIITKKSDDYNGAAVTGTAGRMADAWGRGSVSAGVGRFFKTFDFTAAGFYSDGRRTDQPYTDFSGNTYGPETDLMRTRAANLNLGINAQELQTRFILDFYKIATMDFVTDYTTDAYDVDFVSYLGEVKYNLHPLDRLTITPKLNIKRTQPWRILDPSYDIYYDKAGSRYTGNVTANFDVNNSINLVGGAEAYLDRAANLDAMLAPEDREVFPNGQSTIQYYNISSFAQALLKTKWVNIIIGGRIDWHNEYGFAFSPRAGFTGVLDKFHYKFLFSRAFRAPGIENIEYGKNIVPEKTSVVEMELGYLIHKNIFITANLFDITIYDPIVYSVLGIMNDSTGVIDEVEAYVNHPRTGSAGLELESRLKYHWGYLTLGYSYYSASLFDGTALSQPHFQKNEVASYAVEGHPQMYLGFPQHKLTLQGSYRLGPVTVNPSFVWNSKRYGYSAQDTIPADTVVNAPGDTAFTEESYSLRFAEFAPSFRLNLYVRYPDFLVKGLCLGAGVYDVLNAKPIYIEPYDGGVAPYPGPSREFLLRLSYDLKM